jgi:cold shock CspA family protein
MFAVSRQVSSRAFRWTAASHTQSFVWRSFSTSDEFLTGSVKFFIRNKAYGFIIPDDPTAAGSSEIWVHRTSFDTPHSTDEFPTRPYLYKEERVKFRVEDPESEGMTKKAIDLSFENGKLVPLFRKNYHLSAIKGENQRLGEFLLEVMKEDNLTAEERMEKIKTAVAATEEAIAFAERNQQIYGPASMIED